MHNKEDSWSKGCSNILKYPNELFGTAAISSIAIFANTMFVFGSVMSFIPTATIPAFGTVKPGCSVDNAGFIFFPFWVHVIG